MVLNQVLRWGIWWGVVGVCVGSTPTPYVTPLGGGSFLARLGRDSFISIPKKNLGKFYVLIPGASISPKKFRKKNWENFASCSRNVNIPQKNSEKNFGKNFAPTFQDVMIFMGNNNEYITIKNNGNILEEIRHSF